MRICILMKAKDAQRLRDWFKIILITIFSVFGMLFVSNIKYIRKGVECRMENIMSPFSLDNV